MIAGNYDLKRDLVGANYVVWFYLQTYSKVHFGIRFCLAKLHVVFQKACERTGTTQVLLAADSCSCNFACTKILIKSGFELPSAVHGIFLLTSFGLDLGPNFINCESPWYLVAPCTGSFQSVSPCELAEVNTTAWFVKATHTVWMKDYSQLRHMKICVFLY